MELWNLRVLSYIDDFHVNIWQFDFQIVALRVLSGFADLLQNSKNSGMS